MDKVGTKCLFESKIEVPVFLDDDWRCINHYLGVYSSLRRTPVNVLSLLR